jgi:hypothetical protein
MKGGHKKQNMTNHSCGEPVDQSRLLNPDPPTEVEMLEELWRSIHWVHKLLVLLAVGSCFAFWYWAVQAHDQNLERQFGHKHNNRTTVEQRNY